MIYSMTAYAREEVKADWGTAVWELRSVNQRYLETYFRLPEQFRGVEPVLRERLRQALQRGKVECGLRFTANPGASSELKINEALATALLRSAEWVQSQGAKASIDPIDVLRWPGSWTPSASLKKWCCWHRKLDVAEELDRLDSHIKETRNVLRKGGAAAAA